MGRERFKILLGIDFSSSSLRALDHAIELAQRTGGQLDLLHVFPFTTLGMLQHLVVARDDVARLTDARADLLQLRATRVPVEVPTHTHLRVGDPRHGLLDEVLERRPDIVVVGSHGRGAVMRAFMGSVSEWLVRHSPVPVVVVPVAGRAAALGAEAEAEAPAEAPVRMPMEIAWSCASCGHIRKAGGSSRRCAHCHQEPAVWDSAPVLPGPVDALAPAVGQATVAEESRPNTYDPAETFAITPPGVEGIDINPELRVRH